MGGSTPTRRQAAAATVAVALTGLATAASAAAGILGADPPPKAQLATSGNQSELVKKLPIAKRPGARDRVVMSLGPDELKRIEAGDTIRAGGEVQVSTTCVRDEPRCIGRPYPINPTVTAKIVLAAEPNATAPSLPLSEQPVSRLCKQRRPNRNHHCTLAMRNVETAIPTPGGLPCPANACYVNMLVGASHPNARKGNVVVVGADRPDASVVQDKGRLNVVQARADVPPPAVSQSSDVVSSALPLTEGKKVKRRVVHSLPITAPKKGDVLAFDSSFVANISGLRFNTFVSARVIVAESPTSTEPTGIAKQAAILRGDATESNGFNCTLGPSGYSNPCTVVKSGATRIRSDAVDALGQPQTLYLNVVGAAKPLLAEKLKGAPRISIRPSGGLDVYRYSP
jgi:hypothetical protein